MQRSAFYTYICNCEPHPFRPLWLRGQGPRGLDPGPRRVAVVRTRIVSVSSSPPRICHECFHFCLTDEETKDREAGLACSWQSVVLHREREARLDSVPLTTHPLVCSPTSFTSLFVFHSLGEGFSDHHFF